jgi:ribonucleoside-diphosphate reductase alpha chain
VNNREEAARPEQLVLEVTTSAAPTAASASQAARTVPAASFAAIQNQEDAPPCSTCGSIMVRSGACYKCTNCGTTSGCA